MNTSPSLKYDGGPNSRNMWTCMTMICGLDVHIPQCGHSMGQFRVWRVVAAELEKRGFLSSLGTEDKGGSKKYFRQRNGMIR